MNEPFSLEMAAQWTIRPKRKEKGALASQTEVAQRFNGTNK
jgi:hypothetical protein